jgi:hypothetical protein
MSAAEQLRCCSAGPYLLSFASCSRMVICSLRTCTCACLCLCDRSDVCLGYAQPGARALRGYCTAAGAPLQLSLTSTWDKGVHATAHPLHIHPSFQGPTQPMCPRSGTAPNTAPIAADNSTSTAPCATGTASVSLRGPVVEPQCQRPGSSSGWGASDAAQHNDAHKGALSRAASSPNDVSLCCGVTIIRPVHRARACCTSPLTLLVHL